MKPFSYYSDIDVPYPRPSDFTKVFAYAKGKVIWSGSADEWATAGRSIGTKLVEKVVDEEALKAARQAYNAAERAKYDEFKRDLFELHGVTGHSKAELCFNMAWEDGHSAGYAEVANVFDRLVDLIKD